MDSVPTLTPGTGEHCSLDQALPKAHLTHKLAGSGKRGRDKNTTGGPPSPLLSLPPGGAAGCCREPLSGFRGVLGLSLLSPNPLSPASGHGEKVGRAGKLSQQTRRWHLPRGVRTLSPSWPTQGQRVWEQLTLPSLTALLAGCAEAPGSLPSQCPGSLLPGHGRHWCWSHWHNDQQG